MVVSPMRDHSTGSEAAAAISAGWDAYPDPPPIEPYELAGDDPHGWPRAAEGPLLEALHAAEAEVTCQGCGQRGKPNVCRHGKCICEDCWPDLCWACQADSETEGPTW